MFLLRSAFWLTIGFMLVAPHGTDFGATAAQLKDSAIAAGVSAGQQLVASQLAAELTPQHLVSSLASPSVISPMHQTSTVPDMVFPHPRPAALG